MRTLYANEIECRVGHSTTSGASLLLYKDARVDMRILDEVFGPTNWQRRHEVVNGNLFCTIEIWDAEKRCWVAKQDVGTESNTEKEKGEASDSFKRAGFNWGIGRELYTAPFIWVNITTDDLDSKGKIKTKFLCKEIGYNENKEINHLVIVDTKGNPRYTYGKSVKMERPKEVTLQDAITEMRSCKSFEDVYACWNRYPQYKESDDFKTACTEQGIRYPKNANYDEA